MALVLLALLQLEHFLGQRYPTLKHLLGLLKLSPSLEQRQWRYRLPD
jgi:hypothetical protein